MLSSPVLNTGVGLALLFTVMALVCSGITECLSNVLQLRAKYLLTGVRAMLDAPERTVGRDRTEADRSLPDRVKDPSATRAAVRAVHEPAALTSPSGPILTCALFDDPLLTSLQSRRVGFFRKGRLRNPQYVASRTFSSAVTNLLVPAVPEDQLPTTLTIDKIRKAVQNLPLYLPVRQPLLAFLARAGNNCDLFESAVEQWYDEQMVKIADWYKRWARVVLGIVGFVIAVLANIDAVQVTHALYVDAPLQQAVAISVDAGTLCQDAAVGAAQADCVQEKLATLQADGLPIGYPSGCGLAYTRWTSCWAWSNSAPVHWWDFPLKLLGWLMSSFVISFGAPYLFDLLSRLSPRRVAGPEMQSAAVLRVDEIHRLGERFDRLELRESLDESVKASLSKALYTGDAANDEGGGKDKLI
jgi:hypothetical protein